MIQMSRFQIQRQDIITISHYELRVLHVIATRDGFEAAVCVWKKTKRGQVGLGHTYIDIIIRM